MERQAGRTGHNQIETLKDPTAHAEMIAITQGRERGRRLASDRLRSIRHQGALPHVRGAIVHARIPLVVWGMTDPQRGGCVSLFKILQSGELNHRAEILAGVLEDECRGLIQDFFKKRRSC